VVDRLDVPAYELGLPSEVSEVLLLCVDADIVEVSHFLGILDRIYQEVPVAARAYEIVTSPEGSQDGVQERPHHLREYWQPTQRSRSGQALSPGVS